MIKINLNKVSPILIFICGPTASGKSNFAMEMALKFKGEIVNGDAIQVYQQLDIGTAKPSLLQRQTVPHHIIDIVKVGELFTAGDFYREVLKTIEIISINNGTSVFFIVGGSGFYFQALEYGLFTIPTVPKQIRNDLIKEAECLGFETLYKELQEIDFASSQKIHQNDTYRILRALEIWRAHGLKLSEVRSQFDNNKKKLPWPILKILLSCSKDSLKKKIEDRTKSMLSNNWIDEVIRLRQQGFGNWPPMKSVGYKEVQEYLDGKIALHELEPKIIQSTMALAKRQMTWFHRDKKFICFDSDSQLDHACNHISDFLNIAIEYTKN